MPPAGRTAEDSCFDLFVHRSTAFAFVAVEAGYSLRHRRGEWLPDDNLPASVVYDRQADGEKKERPK